MKGITNLDLLEGTDELIEFASDWRQSSWVKQRELEWQAGCEPEYKKPQIIFYSNDHRTFDPAGKIIADYGLKVRELMMKMYGVNLMLTASNLWLYMSPKDNEQRHSQMWHRDPPVGNRMPLKVFLWCHEVKQENGPFQYILQTRPTEKYWSEVGRVDAYPPEEDINKSVAPEDIVTCTTSGVVLTAVETIGLHRGGNVQPGFTRLSGHWVFYQAD
jgi:hypothetical protein